MTVLQPKKTKELIYFCSMLGVILAMGAAFSVSQYVACVSIEHDLVTLREETDALAVRNAELKSALYKKTEAVELERLAREKGLIQDTDPQWAFASQH